MNIYDMRGGSRTRAAQHGSPEFAADTSKKSAMLCRTWGDTSAN